MKFVLDIQITLTFWMDSIGYVQTPDGWTFTLRNYGMKKMYSSNIKIIYFLNVVIFHKFNG